MKSISITVGDKDAPFAADLPTGAKGQTSDEHGIATPANWQPGEDVIVPPPGSCGVAKDRTQEPDPDVSCLDWFMCLKKLPEDK